MTTEDEGNEPRVPGAVLDAALGAAFADLEQTGLDQHPTPEPTPIRGASRRRATLDGAVVGPPVYHPGLDVEDWRGRWAALTEALLSYGSDEQLRDAERVLRQAVVAVLVSPDNKPRRRMIYPGLR